MTFAYLVKQSLMGEPDLSSIRNTQKKDWTIRTHSQLIQNTMQWDLTSGHKIRVLSTRLLLPLCYIGLLLNAPTRFLLGVCIIASWISGGIAAFARSSFSQSISFVATASSRC